MSEKRLWFTEARNKKNLTQEKLAWSLGVSTSTIEKIESGKLDPGLNLAFLLADALEIDIRLFQKITA